MKINIQCTLFNALSSEPYEMEYSYGQLWAPEIPNSLEPLTEAWFSKYTNFIMILWY